MTENGRTGTGQETGHRGGWIRAGLILAGTLVLVAGVWGLLWNRSGSPGIGTVMEHGSGQFVVVGAYPVDDPMSSMSAANSQQFAASGMSMNSMLPDAVPEGMKRVAVEVNLAAGTQAMRFPADDVSLIVDRKSFAPYRALLGDERLDPGARINGVVVFEVPVETSAADFRLSPTDGAVAVDVSGGGHSMSDHARPSPS